MPDPVGQGAPAGGLSPDSSVSLSSPTTGTGTAAASRRAKVKAAPTETNTHKGEQLQKLHANLFLSSVETQLSFRGKQYFESDLTPCPPFHNVFELQHLDEGGRQHPRRSYPDCHDPEVWDPVNVHGSPLVDLIGDSVNVMDPLIYRLALLMDDWPVAYQSSMLPSSTGGDCIAVAPYERWLGQKIEHVSLVDNRGLLIALRPAQFCQTLAKPLLMVDDLLFRINVMG
ncbi:hypothetical protein EJB05_12324, partial [Eragrostis curvula]